MRLQMQLCVCFEQYYKKTCNNQNNNKSNLLPKKYQLKAIAHNSHVLNYYLLAITFQELLHSSTIHNNNNRSDNFIPYIINTEVTKLHRCFYHNVHAYNSVGQHGSKFFRRYHLAKLKSKELQKSVNKNISNFIDFKQ